MKQLYAAGPIASGSPDSAAADAPPTFRAGTAGLLPEELPTAILLSGFKAPPGRPPESDRPMPVRLALVSTVSAGRVLVHVSPGEKGYFSHALLHVPPTADAQLAIQTWGSPMWQRSEPHTFGDLPDLPYLPVADALDDAVVKEWLSTAAKRELLEFTLTALLGTPPHSKVFVVAPAEDVAKLVYAVTRAFPTGMLDDFTFSTYESEPRSSPARLVGYDGGSAEWDLPSDCYAEGGVGFNTFTGRQSLISTQVPFAEFAANALASGEFGPLDEFKATWQRLGMSGYRQFDLVFRLARGTGVLTKPEATEALQYPPLAAWVAGRTDAQKQFLEWALDDRDFANTSFSRVVQSLRQKTDVITKLGTTVREEGLKALKAGDKNRTANALEVILPMVAPAKANAVWGELLGQITDPDSLSWEMRWYLLSRFVRFKQQQNANAGVDPTLAKWTAVPAEKLAEMLAVELPRAYHLAGARATLAREGEPSAVFARTLALHPTLAHTLLQPVDGKVDPDKPTKLYDVLLAEAPSHPWFEDLVGKASDYPASLLNKFFEATLTAGKIDADHLIRTQGPRVLELFQGQSGLDRVGRQFLADPPVDILHTPSLLEFLGKLREEPQVGEDVKTRAAAVQAVRTYLDDPTFTADAMKPAAEALAITPPVVPPITKTEVFDAVAGELLKRAGDAGLQTDLEAALVHFGPVLATDSTDLYENLLRELRGRTDFARNTNLAYTFLAVALGATESPELAGKLDGLDVQAFAIAAEAGKRGGNRMLTEIDRRTESWPKSAKTQWGFLKAAVQPPGIKRLVRDVAMFAAGVVLASIGWLVYGLVK